MSVIAIDLGGTKLAAAIISATGEMLYRESVPLAGRGGRDVGALVTDRVSDLWSRGDATAGGVSAIGVAVPGIYRPASGRVWAPNIPGWDDYPLLQEIADSVAAKSGSSHPLPVSIDSDRACCILGETWRGVARESAHAIFVAVGTGIGAGIMVDGRIVRGAHDIAGAIGWMALDRPYREEYAACGCLEFHASGPGIARAAQRGDSTRAAFLAYDAGQEPAHEAVETAIAFWGMTVANLVSLLNPEVIVFGGGVFGPAARFLDRIRAEALRWAQPISMQQVRLEVTALGGDAALYGAARLALATGAPASDDEPAPVGDDSPADTATA